jgi:hypothetical protein
MGEAKRRKLAGTYLRETNVQRDRTEADADQAFLAATALRDAPASLTMASPSRLVRRCADTLNELLIDLKRSVASNGGGVDREPATVMRDLGDAVAQLSELATALALDEEPGAERARKTHGHAALKALHAIATENGGLCSVVFYGRPDLRNLEEHLVAGDQRVLVHVEAMCRVIRALETKRPPRCVLCAADIDEEKPLQLIAVVQGYCEDPIDAVGSAICVHCAARHQTQTALRDAVVKVFRDRLQVNLRVLPALPVPPGRA